MPYRQPLIHWGTALHDRFMLPHCVAEDFQDVLRDLQEAGYGFKREWFAPHFVFPTMVGVTQQGITLELQSAIEPGMCWVKNLVLVVQCVMLIRRLNDYRCRSGMTDTRHVVTCNGRRVPLQPTGVEHEYVAGVRYRAWQPPACLHPTIPVHTPLVFDIVDTWNGRAIGGCTYHVAHPGGRNYTAFPVNAYEAEGRRLARFPLWAYPGVLPVPPPEANPQFPYTLDLRRKAPRWKIAPLL